MAEQEQDRTEPATPFKLEEARKKGQVARSLEWNSFFALTAAILMSLFLSGWAVQNVLEVCRGLMSHVGSMTVSEAEVLSLLLALARSVFGILGPLMGLMMISAVLSNLTQSGAIFSAHPLKPDFSRLNPINGLKRLFSLRVLYEGFKSILKMFLFGLIVTLVIAELMPDLFRMLRISPVEYPAILIDRGNVLLFFLLIAVLVIALLDLVFVRWDFGRQMRMSRRELREEVRRREGDPHILGKRREVQQEIRKKTASLGKVKEADVLITNPQHVAVALKYDRKRMKAPIIVSKGAGYFARRLRRLAIKHGITIIREPRLARSLYKNAPINHEVPPESYGRVAEVLNQVYTKRRLARERREMRD